MDWIRLNEDGEVEFVAEEIKLVPELQALYTLNYNKDVKGDLQGRKRLRALNELKYMYLMYSPKSPYAEAYSEKEKLEEAKKDCQFSEHWVESPELKALITKYVKGTTSRVTKSTRLVTKFLDKLETHLESINLDERNQAGGLVHKPREVMQTLQELPRFLTTLQELEQQARLGIVQTPTSKGDHELGWMALNGKETKRKPKEEIEEVEDGD